MIVSACRDGKSSYAFVIPKKERDKNFKKDWQDVMLLLPEKDNERKIIIKITPSFWKDCHKIKGREVKAWLTENNFIDWPRRKPYKFNLELVSDNIFRLSLIS
ncbi:MAG: hypothetical protein ACRC4W_06390 [Treponemataceae bacterium]